MIIIFYFSSNVLISPVIGGQLWLVTEMLWHLTSSCWIYWLRSRRLTKAVMSLRNPIEVEGLAQRVRPLSSYPIPARLLPMNKGETPMHSCQASFWTLPFWPYKREQKIAALNFHYLLGFMSFSIQSYVLKYACLFRQLSELKMQASEHVFWHWKEAAA